MENHVNIIIGKEHQNYVKLVPDEIMYIENKKYGSLIHINKEIIKNNISNETLTTKEKLAQIYSRLKDYGFVYAHNSYIVNMKYVKTISTKGYLTFTDGKELNISRSRQKAFIEAFYQYDHL